MNSFYGIFDLAPLREKYKTSGHGVKVSILDTGIDLNNPILKNRVLAIRDLSNPVNGTGQDTDGHGTLLAGIITSLAPSCDLLIGKIMLRSGFYTQDAFADGVRWALRNGAEIICVASGDRFYDKETEEIVKLAASMNVIVLAAIGNNGKRSPHAGTYPARCSESIAVGAVDDQGAITSFCEVNPTIKMICTPGVEIDSFDLKGGIVPDSGTSQSTAYATAVLALVLSKLKSEGKPYAVSEIKESLFRSCLSRVSEEIAYSVIYPEMLFKSLF